MRNLHLWVKVLVCLLSLWLLGAGHVYKLYSTKRNLLLLLQPISWLLPHLSFPLSLAEGRRDL